MTDHINHITLYQVKMVPRNARQLVNRNSQLEQLYLWFYRFGSPLTSVSIVLKSRNNVILLLVTVLRVLQGVRLKIHCAGLLYW